MALDYFAIISNGVYPTPTPTGAKRAAFAVTMGLLGTLPTVIVDIAGIVGKIVNPIVSNIVRAIKT